MIAREGVHNQGSLLDVIHDDILELNRPLQHDVPKTQEQGTAHLMAEENSRQPAT